MVPQPNTLDRALDVSENLYFHGRFFGMSVQEARAAADDLLEPSACPSGRKRR